MKRRSFFKGLIHLGSAAAITPAFAINTKPESRVLLQDTRIAGSKYYSFNQVSGGILPGDALLLMREGDNPHDKRAVEVFWAGQKLGYLRRTDNAAVASLMDRNHQVRAEVLEMNNPDTYWEPMKIRLWLSV